jgi:hypothetical protein
MRYQRGWLCRRCLRHRRAMGAMNDFRRVGTAWEDGCVHPPSRPELLSGGLLPLSGEVEDGVTNTESGRSDLSRHC